MSLTDDDLKRIGSLLDQRFAENDKKLDARFAENDKRLDARFDNFERRIAKKIDDSAQFVMAEVGKYMEDHLFPMIEEKADKKDIERLEKKIDQLNEKVGDHDRRIRDIEHLSTVAQELRIKKKTH